VLLGQTPKEQPARWFEVLVERGSVAEKEGLRGEGKKEEGLGGLEGLGRLGDLGEKQWLVEGLGGLEDLGKKQWLKQGLGKLEGLVEGFGGK